MYMGRNAFYIVIMQRKTKYTFKLSLLSRITRICLIIVTVVTCKIPATVLYYCHDRM